MGAPWSGLGLTAWRLQSAAATVAAAAAAICTCPPTLLLPPTPIYPPTHPHHRWSSWWPCLWAPPPPWWRSSPIGSCARGARALPARGLTAWQCRVAVLGNTGCGRLLRCWQAPKPTGLPSPPTPPTAPRSYRRHQAARKLQRGQMKNFKYLMQSLVQQAGVGSGRRARARVGVVGCAGRARSCSPSARCSFSNPGSPAQIPPPHPSARPPAGGRRRGAPAGRAERAAPAGLCHHRPGALHRHRLGRAPRL